MAGILTLLLGICVLLHVCANVYAGCDNCESQTCPDGQPQSCHPVKNRCVCHPRQRRQVDAEVNAPSEGGRGCNDCGYLVCDNGCMHCERNRDVCVCPPGGTALG